MIRLDHLSKSFQGKPALHDLSLDIAAGEIFGLLGHNGAGKSTTFGLILGQLRPTAGEAFVRGVSITKDRAAALQRVGAIFETPAFYDYLSGWKNLRILTSYSGHLTRAEIEEAVGFVGLERRINDPVKTYSHGMRQRLALAQALLPKPELILLDEPAEGLDPEGIRELRHLILRLNHEQGMTVVLSSHLLTEVQETCSRVAILNGGRLVFQGRWEDLGTAKNAYRLALDDWQKAAGPLAAAGVEVKEDHNVVLPAKADVADVVAALVNAGVRVRAVEPVRHSLEQLYLDTIGKR